MGIELRRKAKVSRRTLIAGVSVEIDQETKAP
jgi:hypothetical protein